MDKLKNARIYLSGPIEDSPDLGTGWRKIFKKLIKENELKIHLLDPCNKPNSFTHEIADEKIAIDELKKNKDWEGMRQFVSSFRRQDLRFTDIADCLVIYVDKKVHMCGSYDELFLAERQRKPIFCIVEGGIDKLPTWLFGVFRLENIFSNVEDCVDYLVKLNSQEEELNNCWVLIGNYLDHYE